MSRRARVMVGAAVVVVLVLFFGFLDWQRDRDLATINDRYDRLALAYQDIQQVAADEGVEAPSLDEVTSPGPTPAVRVQGDPGPQGERGPAGPRGPGGADGAAGLAGRPGADGPVGVSGDDGADGTDGAAGAPGADGEDGVTGEVGPPGPSGPAGADGAPGPQGPQGEMGVTGPMPAAIIVPAEGGGTCEARDDDGNGTYECPPP